MRTAHRNASLSKRQALIMSNPFLRPSNAQIKTKIERDLRELQIDAGIHAFVGESGVNMVDRAGRICFISASAGAKAGYTADSPEMRIVRGLSEALGDLAADLDNVEKYRLSIQSGLAAADRILANCDAFDIAAAAMTLDQMLASAQGLKTNDVRKAMGID